MRENTQFCLLHSVVPEALTTPSKHCLIWERFSMGKRTLNFLDCSEAFLPIIPFSPNWLGS